MWSERGALGQLLPRHAEFGACGSIRPGTVVDWLYFAGVRFLRKRKSSLVIGVGEDAALVARTIAARGR